MSTHDNGRVGLDRRSTLKLGGSALAVASTVGITTRAHAATTLSLWTGYPELAPYFKVVAESYAKANPGFELQVLSTTLREAEQKLSAAIPTGTGPDIADMSNAIAIKFIGAKLLDPNPDDVASYLKSGAWNDFTVDYFTIDGKTYGLPLLEGRAAMYYNKTMFKEAGLAGPPTTLSELMAAARKIVQFDSSGKMTRSGISMRLSGQGSGITEKFRFVLEPAGGQLLKPVGGGKWRNGFDNEAGRNTLQFYVDVVQNDKVDDPRFPHDADAFATSLTGMLFREAWVIGEIAKKNPGLDYGVVPIPRWAEGGPFKSIVQPWGIYVNGKSGKKPAAWDFIKFMTNVENAFLLTQMSGWSSRRNGVDWTPLLSQTPQFEVFVKPPANVELFADPVLPVFDEIQTRIADRLPGLYTDTSLARDPAKVAEAVSGLAAIADRILKQANLYG